MTLRSFGKQILGTVIAVVAGWLGSILVLNVHAFIQMIQEGHVDWELILGGSLLTSAFMAYFIIPIWLLVLIPLYLFVPSSSVLWCWPVCTACGAIAGAIIVSIAFGGLPGLGRIATEAWPFPVIAAVVGGIACLVGSLTRQRFKQTS